MFSNPAFWSSIGFWILVAGLVAEGIVLLFIPAGVKEKLLNLACIVIIILGIAIEHIADSERFGPRVLYPKQLTDMAMSAALLELSSGDIVS